MSDRRPSPAAQLDQTRYQGQPQPPSPLSFTLITRPLRPFSRSTIIQTLPTFNFTMSANPTQIICGVTCDCAVKPVAPTSTPAGPATGCEAKAGCSYAASGGCSCADGVCQASAAKQQCAKATSVSRAGGLSEVGGGGWES